MEYNLSIWVKLAYSIVIEFALIIPLLMYVSRVIMVRKFSNPNFKSDGSIPSSLGIYLLLTHLPSVLLLSFTKINGLGYLVIGGLNILVIWGTWILSK